MEPLDLAVQELYRRAELDPRTACGAPRLAAALLGDNCIRRVRRGALRCGGMLGWDGDAFVINVPDGLSPPRVNHAVAHELGELYLHWNGYVAPDREELARRIGAALCVPEPAFRCAHRMFGDDLVRLSRHFVVSESLMSLRLAEILGPATALLTGRRVVIRGQPWRWPSTMDGWLELVRRAPARGFLLRRLTDVRGRFVLRLAKVSSQS